VNGGQEKPVSVVVIDRDGMSRSSIKKHLAAMGAKVAGEAESLASGMSLVSGLHPDILILELPPHGEQALDTVRTLRGDHPHMGIIITAKDASPQLILRSMRAGAQEYLTRPIDNNEMAEAVKRLSEIGRRSVSGKKKTGKVVTVFSGKGGVGVTSLATNLAVSFAKNAKKRTVVVDLNLQMGDVGLQLDLRPEYTMAEALGAGALDESRLKGLLARHESGVSLLSAPEDPVEAEKITPSLLLEIFSLLKNMFDVIVVDAGHYFDSRVLEVLQLADIILVVSVLDVPTVRNVRRSLALFEQLGYSRNKVRLVVNRQQKKTKVTAEDLEETAEIEVYWQVPNDYKTLIAAIDAGVPAVVQANRSKFSRSIEEMTRDLVEEFERGAPVEAPPDAGTSEPQSVSR
jgi:pilus assembly protein CpaE